MVAKVAHGAKDFAEPFVIADVVANEIGDSHGGTSSHWAFGTSMTKEAAFPRRW
jgi:hypothetical protein